MAKVALPEGYEVLKQEYEVPCEHIACDLMHRHLYNSEYEKPQLIDVFNMEGESVGARWESRFHMKQRVEWVILLNGQRVGDAHGTKGEAVAEAMTKPTI